MSPGPRRGDAPTAAATVADRQQGVLRGITTVDAAAGTRRCYIRDPGPPETLKEIPCSDIVIIDHPPGIPPVKQ